MKLFANALFLTAILASEFSFAVAQDSNNSPDTGVISITTPLTGIPETKKKHKGQRALRGGNSKMLNMATINRIDSSPVHVVVPPTTNDNDRSLQASSVQIQLQVLYDDYPEETSFTVRNKSSGAAVYQGPQSAPANGELQMIDLQVAPGDYVVEIADSYGDGMCCSYGNGYFDIYQLNTSGNYPQYEYLPIRVFNGVFESSATVEFTTEPWDTATTLPPTPTSPPNPTEFCPLLSNDQCTTSSSCTCDDPRSLKYNAKDFNAGVDCFGCVLPDYSDQQCGSIADCDVENSQCECVKADIFPFVCHQKMCIPKSGAATGQPCYTSQFCASGNCLYQNGDSLQGICIA